MSELEGIKRRWLPMKPEHDKFLEATKALGKVTYHCHQHPDEHYEVDWTIGWSCMQYELSSNHCLNCGSSAPAIEGVHVSSSAPKCIDNGPEITHTALLRAYCNKCVNKALRVVQSSGESKREEKK